MVIHDLKHPTDSVLSQLKFMKLEIIQLERKISKQAKELKELEKEIQRLKEAVNGDFKHESGLIKTTN